MEHITGNVAQDMAFSYGEFIRIKDHRFRKDLIFGYSPWENKPKPEETWMIAGWGIVITYQGQNPVFIPYESEESAKTECEKLDWIYKKDLKNDKS